MLVLEVLAVGVVELLLVEPQALLGLELPIRGLVVVMAAHLVLTVVVEAAVLEQ
jgi:hypothetical protein